MRLRLIAIGLLSMLLAACAPGQARLATAPLPRHGAPVWAFEASDVPVEREFRFGQLDNAMRFVIRRNTTPAATAAVRMEVATGSLDEGDTERGFAHFVEHMAFNGSTRVPEGEMVRLLERHGLAFGADTNAATSFETTSYRLDLPRNDPELLATALMLMRETASELSFAPEAVARERGVVLAELRERDTWAMRNAIDQAKFLHPRARFPDRFPGGAVDTVSRASAQDLSAFWRRTYVPARTTIVVIGDFDEAQVEAAITSHFADWKSAPAPPQPGAGPVETGAPPRTGLHLDPALSERITASRHARRREEPDTLAQRRENVLRQIGYGVVNRRLARLARGSDAPFRDAGFGTGDVFKAGRTTNLIVDTIDGKWRKGLIAAAHEYRRAMRFGFTPGEIGEQVANLRTAAASAAASAATRSNASLANAVSALLNAEIVPSAPQSSLERLDAFIPQITPKRVLGALRREVAPLSRPHLRLQGRKMPQGGEAALRAAWNEGMEMPVRRATSTASAAFAYDSFGPVGTIISDSREAALGIRQLRFANGVRLNIKQTGLEKDMIRVQISIDGGDKLVTRDNPLATQMVSMLPVGGLGQHDEDALQTILAGRTVSTTIASAPDAFVAAARTTPADLELQLKVMAAMVTDPGYRKQAEVKYRLNINNWFARARATPGSALATDIGGILSDDDPRFTVQPIDAYRKLTAAKLKADLADRLANGAIEIAVVGDIDEETAVAALARSFGALGPREAEFRDLADRPPRTFTAQRGQRVIRHTGGARQALLQRVWPTRDDSDPLETLGLGLLERVVRVALTESLRERLGKAYSPGASSAPSHYWRGYGTFQVSASIDLAEVDAARAAIDEAIRALAAAPPGDDLLLRARQPMLESLDNALKTNSGWMALAARAQSEPDRIARHLAARDRLAALTPRDIQTLARRYLGAENAVEVLVLPEGAGNAANP
jgi:zinc protease